MLATNIFISLFLSDCVKSLKNGTGIKSRGNKGLKTERKVGKQGRRRKRVRDKKRGYFGGLVSKIIGK